jgi:predicted DCC family thiol-disulfide oxidoreductase YuxK
MSVNNQSNGSWGRAYRKRTNILLFDRNSWVSAGIIQLVRSWDKTNRISVIPLFSMESNEIIKVLDLQVESLSCISYIRQQFDESSNFVAHETLTKSDAIIKIAEDVFHVPRFALSFISAVVPRILRNAFYDILCGRINFSVPKRAC